MVYNQHRVMANLYTEFSRRFIQAVVYMAVGPLPPSRSLPDYLQRQVYIHRWAEMPVYIASTVNSVHTAR